MKVSNRKMVYAVSFLVLLLASCGKRESGNSDDLSTPTLVVGNTIIGELDWKDNNDTRVAHLNINKFISGRNHAGESVQLPKSIRCTGFLIAENLLMTNHHCISQARDINVGEGGVLAQFEFHQDKDVDRVKKFKCNSLIASNKKLDFTILRCSGSPGSNSNFGHVTLSTVMPRKGQSINIIHQNCDSLGGDGIGCRPYKKISRGVVKSSYRFSSSFRHNADTLGGSSGSPVFADGLVIGIHNQGTRANRFGRAHKNASNSAIKMAAILSHLKSKHQVLYREIMMESKDEKKREFAASKIQLVAVGTASSSRNYFKISVNTDKLSIEDLKLIKTIEIQYSDIDDKNYSYARFMQRSSDGYKIRLTVHSNAIDYRAKVTFKSGKSIYTKNYAEKIEKPSVNFNHRIVKIVRKKTILTEDNNYMHSLEFIPGQANDELIKSIRISSLNRDDDIGHVDLTTSPYRFKLITGSRKDRFRVTIMLAVNDEETVVSKVYSIVYRGSVVAPTRGLEEREFLPEDFAVKLFHHPKDSDRSLDSYRFRPYLMENSEGALQAVESVRFFIHPGHPKDPICGGKSVKKTRRSGIFYCSRVYETVSKGWTTGGAEVILSDGTELIVPGVEVQW